MKTIILKNGIEIPAIGFGPCFLDVSYKHKNKNSLLFRVARKAHKKTYDEPKYVSAVQNALKIGYRLIDYSAAYGDGSLVAKGIEKSGINRSDIILTTRISNSAQFNDSVEIEFQSQLKSFRTDYIDILMFHWPVTEHYEKTWEKMIQLKEKKYCRILGVANCNIHHLETLYASSGVYPEINQFEVHPLLTQKELIHYCQEHEIQVEAYTPTARQDDRIFKTPLMMELSKKYNKTINQIILKWHCQNGVIPIFKSLNPAHLLSNISIDDFTISSEDMHRIDSLNINSRLRFDPDNCDFRML